MSINKKWFYDWHHDFIFAAFVLGLAAYVIGQIMADRASGALGAAVLVPLALAAFKRISMFFQSPPSDPSDALAEGEGKAGSRGVARVGLVASLAIVGVIILACAGIGADCNGAISPAVQAEIEAAEQLGQCIEQTYAADTQKTPVPNDLQIGVDIALGCGADVSDLATAFASPADAGQGAASDASPPSAPAIVVAPTRAAVVAAAKANAEPIHRAALAHRMNVKAAALANQG